MAYFHAKQQSSSVSSSSCGMPGRQGGWWGLWGVHVANSNHGKVHGAGPWGVQTTRSHMARLYKKGVVPGRSDMEFCWTVGARRAGHSDSCAPLCSSTAVGISIPMYTIWGTKKRSFKPQRSWKSLIWSLLAEIWLDESHDWSTAIDGYKPGLALYLNRWRLHRSFYLWTAVMTGQEFMTEN